VAIKIFKLVISTIFSLFAFLTILTIFTCPPAPAEVAGGMGFSGNSIEVKIKTYNGDGYRVCPYSKQIEPVRIKVVCDFFCVCFVAGAFIVMWLASSSSSEGTQSASTSRSCLVGKLLILKKYLHLAYARCRYFRLDFKWSNCCLSRCIT